MGENQDDCAILEMKKINHKDGSAYASKMSLYPSTVCKIISRAIKLMGYCRIKNCRSWSVLVGENTHFAGECA